MPRWSPGYIGGALRTVTQGTCRPSGALWGACKDYARSFVPYTSCRRTFTHFSHRLPAQFVFHPTVQRALQVNRPVVAMESAIITHGLPPDEARILVGQCNQIVRSKGAIPATIAIMDGLVRIGLTDAEVDKLIEKSQSEPVQKIGARELAHALASEGTGGTTVSATSRIAELCKIPVFATGGIGGVHRGAEHTFDISSDLTTLAASSLIVVCAGAKSILDVGLTLEFLETQGVPVFSYESDRWPAFYTADSGYPAPRRADSPQEIAQAFMLHRQMGMGSAFLIGNPFSGDEALNEKAHQVQSIVDAVVGEALEKGISGQEVTPWILGQVAKRTEGQSVDISTS